MPVSMSSLSCLLLIVWSVASVLLIIVYFMEEFWENFESKIAWGGSEDEEEDEASVDNEDGGSDGEDEASV